MTLTLPPPGEILHWLGGPIDVRVEIDTGLAGSSFGQWDVSEWDESTWGSVNPDWNDITHFVLDVVIDRGASRWGERFSAGTASIILDNTDGFFTPDSLVPAPWHLPFRPGRRIRVVAYPDPDSPLDAEYLFYGEIDASFDLYADAAFDLTVTIPLTDFMGSWADFNPPALVTPTGVEDTDERVNSALDRLSWPAGLRNIQTGLHTMTSSFLAQSTLEECMTAADAEGGAFYCSKDGKATFKARDWLSVDARSVSVQGYIGYESIPSDSFGAHILGVKTSWDITRIVNQVQFARIGSVMQEVEDLDSQSVNGIRSYPRTDFQNNLDAEVLFLATRLLGQFRISRARIDEVAITAMADPDNLDLNHIFWATEFGDLISVLIQTGHGWSYEKLVKVMGIRHHITPDDWEVSFRLDDIFTVAGGSIAQITADPFGQGEDIARQGGAVTQVQIDPTGGGIVTGVEGGSIAEVSANPIAGGTIPRVELMGLLAPEAWWRFGDESVDITTDSSGNAHTLTWTGSPANGSGASPITPSDRWVTLDGTDDFATVASESDLELRQDMSIEMWVRPHDASGGNQAIITCRGTGADAPLYEIYYNPNSNNFAFFPNNSASEGAGFGAGIVENEWVHVVVTIDWDGTTTRFRRFYVNGQVLGGGQLLTYIPGVLTRAVNIGRRATDGDLYFDGDISELSVFSRVLTADEVQMLHSSTYLGD